MRTRTLISTALAVLALLGTAVASILPPPPPHELYAEADVVVTGTVTAVGKSAIRVEIDDVLKGAVTETIDVGPVYSPSCTPGDRDQKPYFEVGDDVLIAARLTEHGYRFVDHTLWSTKPGDAGDDAIAIAREMLRLAKLTESARRAAMVRHMSSDEALLVDAAMWFQFTELSTPEQSGPHVAGLIDALDAPNPEGRRAALRALVGLTSPEALPRLIELTEAEEIEDIDGACAVLARYDDGKATTAIFEAAARNGSPWLLKHLGASPRPEALARIRRAMLAGDGEEPAVGVRAYHLRIQTFGPTESDVDDLVAHVRSGLDRSDQFTLMHALSATRSLRAAREMVSVVRDTSSSAVQRDASCGVLWTMASQLEIDDVRKLLIKHASVFIERLDADGQSMYLCWLLGIIHSPEARAALERAEATDPPNWNGDAWRTLHGWDAKK